MDNRHLVTRKLGRVPSKNHHGLLISTPPKKSAAQKFRPAEPIQAVDTTCTTQINFQSLSAKCDALKRPTAHRLQSLNTLSAENPDQRL